MPGRQEIKNASFSHWRRLPPDLTDRLWVAERNISRGKYSDVSKGILIRDGDSEIEVAIKTLRNLGRQTSSKSTSSRSDLQRKLLCEVNIWRRLNHPNVAPLLGISAPPHEPPSLISPWYENGSLTTYLQSFPAANRLYILSDLCDGLAYLHCLHIVHGDIKPENVLVDSDGRACWCDFGISHFVEGAAGRTGKTSSSAFRGGTVPYFSPEQATSENDGRKTKMMDIWAFGCLMAKVISGEELYAHCRTDVAVILEILLENLPMDTLIQRTSNPNQNPLWEIVDRCWLKDPESRPTALEIQDDISMLLGSSPIMPRRRMQRRASVDVVPVMPNNPLHSGQVPIKLASQCFVIFFCHGATPFLIVDLGFVDHRASMRQVLVSMRHR